MPTHSPRRLYLQRWVYLVCGLSIATAGISAGQQPFSTSTSAVVIDVIVRDKDGRPVTNLGKADFAVFEDGVQQEIGDVTVVMPSPTRRESQTKRASDPTTGQSRHQTARPDPAPSFVALVFDRLSPEGRALACKGALAYLDAVQPTDFAGVFLSDLSLQTVQTYTNDPRVLRRAINDVSTRVTSTFDRTANKPLGHAHGDTNPSTSPTASAEDHGPPDPQTARILKRLPDDHRGAEYGAIKMAEAMARSYDALDRDQQGHSTVNSLLALIASLGTLPGRKTVVFFAEALSLPPSVAAKFDSVIASANHHNVSVYTVDAAGLRVHSKVSETARQVNNIGALGAGDRQRGGGAWTKELELNEDILRQDPAVGLGILADRTGGFLIDNTNDLASGFRSIDSDRRFHYLLTYTPKNATFMGEWRKVEVRVPLRKVTVRSRSGYLAVHASGSFPLLSYEGPALAALARTPSPTDVPLRLGAFAFPTGADDRVAVLVTAENGALAFSSTAEGFKAAFVILAVIRDGKGEIVRKASQPYDLHGPSSQLQGIRSGQVLFYRQPTLPAGTYTLSAVVHDVISGRSGVSHLPFTIPAQNPSGPRVSSLVLVGQTERAESEERDPGNPLNVGSLTLYPNLGEPIRRTPEATLGFFVSIIAPVTPTATVELLMQGRSVGRVPLTLSPPDAHKRIQQLSQIPLAALAPGQYVLRLTVSSADASEIREARFTIAE